MITIKTLSVIVLTCSMLYCPALSYAIVKTGGGATQADKSDSTGPESANKISRVTAFVKEMKNNVLVLEDDRRFDLAGVQVINKKSDKGTEGKTVVELIFINNTLKQVVIH